ncbi:MAG: hypothetical protein RLZZ524_662 [Pseudomonadota bacterium]
MTDSSAARFQFIGHALAGDGPFRPTVSTDSTGSVALTSSSALVRYPRESTQKYGRRNELAFYASPLARVCSRFVGYLSARPPAREPGHELYESMIEDIDGKGNAIDVFFSAFEMEAKARGTMLLLVDMPPAVPQTLGAQVAQRAAPYWTVIRPELLTDYQVGDDGRFDFAEFSGNWTAADGKRVPCTWHFDRSSWEARDKEDVVLASGDHPLGECPLLIFTESSEFPCFGTFSAVADLSRRLFNLDSELDEILRSQTFSLLTMQVPDESTDAAKLKAAQVAGETIGTSNLMVHSGSTPAFIAPPDGPARVYMERIKDIRAQIDEIGLVISQPNQVESGVAMQMRFQALNGQLAYFASRMEDLERRAWDLSRRWLGMTSAPTVQWLRDFNLADVENELKVLADMQATNMPSEVLVEQQHRIVSVQFAGLDQEKQGELSEAIDEQLLEPDVPANVVPLRPADPDAELRQALVARMRGSAGGAA